MCIYIYSYTYACMEKTTHHAVLQRGAVHVQQMAQTRAEVRPEEQTAQADVAAISNFLLYQNNKTEGRVSGD